MTQPNMLGSMTLKALLEDPNLQNPPLITPSDNHLKIKKEDDGVPQFNYGSAFLGPNLWNKTYNDPNFNLEYMDLDEFLSENGLPIVAEDTLADLASGDSPAGPNPCLSPSIVTPSLPSSPHVNPSESPRHFLKTPPLSPSQFTSPAVSVPAVSSTISPILPPYSPQNNKSRSPSPPVSPFKVDFQVSEQDLALSSVPDYKESAYQLIRQPWSSTPAGALGKSGHDGFDPRKRNFTDEELKPQPIIKKSKKVFVPDDLKDDKYWARRHKNNFAAKRSRDARRVKENQIAMRASFLEKENDCLKKEMAKLKKENAKLLLTVAKYEGRDMGSSLTLSP